MVRSKTWIGYLAILAVGLGLTGAVGAYWMHEYGAVREHYIANSAAKTRFVADKVESAFSEIYQNIRTLSLLPALKTVDRNGTYLSPEAKITIQPRTFKARNTCASGSRSAKLPSSAAIPR